MAGALLLCKRVLQQLMPAALLIASGFWLSHRSAVVVKANR